MSSITLPHPASHSETTIISALLSPLLILSEVCGVCQKALIASLPLSGDRDSRTRVRVEYSSTQLPARPFPHAFNTITNNQNQIP